MAENLHFGQDNALSFAERLVNSSNFAALFDEGMTLVEETATYLDGDGRDHAKELERPISLAYATESMRLTTRLMQLASWLLLQRAVNDGEMSPEQASSEKNKVHLERQYAIADAASWEDLPEHLRVLVERSIRLQERIKHIDNMLKDSDRSMKKHAAKNPIADQISQLNAAFRN